LLETLGIEAIVGNLFDGFHRRPYLMITMKLSEPYAPPEYTSEAFIMIGRNIDVAKLHVLIPPWPN
jgi:hypothetical protein